MTKLAGERSCGGELSTSDASLPAARHVSPALAQPAFLSAHHNLLNKPCKVQLSQLRQAEQPNRLQHGELDKMIVVLSH